MIEQKNILITGGCGFIGHNLALHLLAQGYKVTIFDSLTYAANIDALKELQTNKAYSFIYGDIRNITDIQRALIDTNPDTIFHLAAESHVDNSIVKPSLFIETNVTGTLNLLQATKEYLNDKHRHFRFIHLSTDEVFGEVEAPHAFSEQSNYNPRSPYAASKAASDHIVRAWINTYGFPAIITNCSNNFGPYQNAEKLIPKIINNCLNDQPLPIYGNGQQVRDWIYVEDSVDALSTIARDGIVGETYLIGAVNTLTNMQIVNAVCAAMDNKLPKAYGYKELIKHVKDRPGHDVRYAVDPSKLYQNLNWKPQYKFRDSLDKTIDWYLSHDTRNS